jgi:hypothetical protein
MRSSWAFHNTTPPTDSSESERQRPTSSPAPSAWVPSSIESSLPIYRGRSGVPDPELQRRQRLAVGRGGRGRSQVRHTPAAPGFRVKHLGQVTPLPTRFASSIAIPIVNTNPNVTQRKPSNVRQAMVCVYGAVSHGNRPTESRVMVMDPATPMRTYATTMSPCRRALRRRR